MKNTLYIFIGALALAIAGCVSSGTYRVGCRTSSDDSWSCEGEIGGSFKQSPDANMLDQYDLRYFDSSKLAVRTASSNVALKATSSQISFTVYLYNDGSLVDARTFSASAINSTTIKASNHPEVTAWVRQYDGMVDDYKIDLQNVMFEQTDGTNTVVLEAYYDNSLDGGGSWSEYINPICLAKPWICDPEDW